MKRRRTFLGFVCLGILVLGSGVSSGQSIGSIVAWGDSSYGQCNVPAPNADFVGVAGGFEHSLGLKSDGTIVSWGRNNFGECNVPAPNADFVGVAGGFEHSLGLKSDGTIVAWGSNNYGQCNVPAPNADFVAVAAGYYHSLGLKSDGTIVAWGTNYSGQCNVPAPNADFVAMAGGSNHSLGLKSDGTIVAWGSNYWGESDVPAPNAGFVAIAGGAVHSLGLKSDGTILAWGHNNFGECNVPAPNADFVAIAGGLGYSLGLKSDGTIVAWGSNNYGQCNVPAPNADFVAITGGTIHSLGLKAFYVSVECPADLVVPGISTIPSLSLVGLRIANVGVISCAYDYYVTATGPATLVDNGNPASLSGTTPTLGPGVTYYPPEAGLYVPAIREYAQEMVTYHANVAGDPGYSDFCTTVITFEPPVPVFIRTFEAAVSEGGVDLLWEVASDKQVASFKIYRSAEGGSASEEAASGGLIPAGARTYADNSVQGGKTYEYTLGVVLADRSEVRSQTVRVKTKAYVLELYQNSPNPFNPRTTISFTLPERARVTLAIYDVKGSLVRTLVDDTIGEWYQERVWDGRDASGNRVSSGVYFYRLTAGDKTLTKRMVLLK